MRRFAWLSYAAESWPYPRSVVLEVEHGEPAGRSPLLLTPRAPVNDPDEPARSLDVDQWIVSGSERV